jgi:hypothetical protein
LRLPAAAEFSPGQVDLRDVLEIVARHSGNRRAIVEALRLKYFVHAAAKQQSEAGRLEQQQKRANNVLIGLKSYGFFDTENRALTEVGKELLRAHDDQALYRAFATHILKRTHGLTVLQAVKDLQARGDRVSKDSLHRELERRGFSLPTATTHHTQLLKWLEKAGVIDTERDYAVEEVLAAELGGVELLVLDRLAELPRDQRAFLVTLRGLAETHGTEVMRTQDIFEACKIQHGRIFKEDQLSARVLQPLAGAGWITLSGRGTGRGGKSGGVAATQKLLELDPIRLAADSGDGVPPELRGRLRTPLEKIYADLGATGTYEKGLALELLALRIVIDLGLLPKGFRERSAQTSGSEVDLICEGVHLHFSRWVLQCKNTTAAVGVSALDKEVGMAIRMRAHVIVLVTTGRFTDTVGQAAHDLATDTNLQVVLVDGAVLERYRSGGMAALIDFFRTQATATMRLKREQLPPTLGD